TALSDHQPSDHQPSDAQSSDDQPSDPSPQPSALGPDVGRPPLVGRIVALLEVLICSDFLTQTALDGTLRAFGYQPFVHGRLSVGYVVTLSLVDAVFLVGLIL